MTNKDYVMNKVIKNGTLVLLVLFASVGRADDIAPQADDAIPQADYISDVDQPAIEESKSTHYIGGGVSLFKSEGFDLPVIDLRYGQNLTDIFAAEVRVGFGVADDENGRLTVKENHFIGAYGRANLPASDTLTAYGFLGMAFVDYIVTTATSVGSANDSQLDVSGGLGGSYRMTEKLSVGAEYWVHDLKDASGINLNLTYEM